MHLPVTKNDCCRNAVEKKTVLENLDLVLLVMDETVDGGYASSALNPMYVVRIIRLHGFSKTLYWSIST